MNKKKAILVILITGIVLVGLTGYLYYKQRTSENKREQTVSDTTTEEKGEIPHRVLKKKRK